jgi:hypothetical protein
MNEQAQLWAVIGNYMNIAGGVMGAVGNYYQGRAARRNMETQAYIEENNATLADWMQRDALERGQRAEQKVRGRVAQVKGSQRARLAANGVVLGEGSALDILTSTDVQGEADALAARYQGEREGWAYGEQARNHRNNATLMRGGASGINPAGMGFSSLLTSAGTVADRWYRWKERSDGGRG